MDFINAVISKDPENNFYHYLLENGTKLQLDEKIVSIEKIFDSEPMCFQKIMIRRYSNKIWEIPTKELCIGLIKLFKYIGINKINELAAGMGMLSALLSHYAIELNFQLEINASTKYNCNFLEDNRFTYYPVQDKKFKDHKSDEPIIISWVHPDNEDKLLDMISDNKPKYVFLLGEHISPYSDQTVCQSKFFHQSMLEYGYSCTIIPFKQVGQMDYITNDKYRPDVGLYSRSTTVMYSIKLFDPDCSIEDIVGKENLGIWLELTEEYVEQDIHLSFINKYTPSLLPKSDVMTFGEKLRKMKADLEALESKIKKIDTESKLRLKRIDDILEKSEPE